MQPLYLSLQGVFSYKEKQQINFAKLTRAGLFGIFGATGSGKSTILDAIMFALYGDYERMNSKDGRLYNMMNLQSDELHIDYSFLFADKEYRFTVYARRNRKRFDDITKHERVAYCKKQGEWIPLESADAGKILGISYENFKRTVIIPQGRFMEFMQLTATERVRMIKELFNLNKFELYNRTAALEKRNDEVLNKCKGQIEQIGTIDPEQIKEKEESLKNHSKEFEAAKKTLSLLQKELEIQTGLKDTFTKLDQLKKREAELDANAEAMQNKDLLLTQYQYCQKEFSTLLLRKDDLDKKQQSNTTALAEKRTEQIRLNAELEAVIKTFDELEKKIARKQVDEQKLRDYNTHLQLRQQTAILQKETGRLPKAEAFIAEVKQAREKSAKQDDELKQKLSELKERTGRFMKLTVIQAKFKELEECLKRIEEAKKHIIALDVLKNEQKQKLAALMQPYGISVESLQFEAMQKALEKHREGLIIQVKLQQEQLETAMVKGELQSLSESLKEGEACPLCGSTEHPVKIHAKAVQEEIKQHRESIEILQKEQETVVKVLSTIASMKTELTAAKKHTAPFSERIHDDTVIRNNFLAELEDYKQDEVHKALADAEKDAEQIKLLETERENIQSTIDNKRKKEQKYTEELLRIKALIIESETKIATFRSQLAVVSTAQLEQYNDEQISQLAQQLSAETEQTDKTFAEISKQKEQLQQKEAGLKGSITVIEKEINENAVQLKNITSEIEKKITASPFDTEVAIRSVLQSNIDSEQLRKEIENYKSEMHLVKSRIEELQQIIGEKTFDNEAFAGLQQKTKESEATVEQLQNDFIRMEQELKLLHRKVKDQEALLKELTALEVRRENIKTLKSMFKSSGFVHYVSTVYLQNLCSAANARFAKLTKQTLRLELSADNNFQVRDYLNNGKLRSVKTLSGGQSFQAALSLALALSESVYLAGKQAQEFFFIDEGFGSQDKESLRIVFETLRSLQKEGKTVGVISHVEDLKEEIGCFISIDKDENRGSIVIES